MASTLILLSLLMFCQIVQDLACGGGGGGRSSSRTQIATVHIHHRKKGEPREHWKVPELLQDQYKIWMAEHTKNQTIQKKLDKKKKSKIADEIDIPDSFKGYGPGFAGEYPPPWAIMEGQQGKPDYCFMDPDVGHCIEKFKRWGYNYYAKECVEFEFSGCGGNFNNFMSKEKCEDLCLHDPQSNCQKNEDYLTYDMNDTTFKIKL